MKDKDGYGRIKYRGKYVPVHWVLAGKPESGMDKDHICEQRDCVRPTHLRDLSRSDNTARQSSREKRRSMTVAERQVAASMLRAGKTVAEVANVTGFSRRTIGRINQERNEDV